MKNTVETIKELQNRCALQEQQIAELTAKLTWYEEQFRLSQQKRFGRSSEQTNHPEQMQLFNEAEKEAEPSLPEPTMEEIPTGAVKDRGTVRHSLKTCRWKPSNTAYPPKSRYVPAVVEICMK